MENDRLVFEDGTEIRFWGTSMIGSACFPPQNLAPDIAERLSQLGFNLVRFQHLDAEWAEPNLFQSDMEEGEFLNPIALDRLDYFLYQLKNRGIYTYVDCLGSRVLRTEDFISEGSAIPPGFGGYIHFSSALQSVYREFLHAFWTHRNRYTGKEYRDSPMIACTQLFYNNNIDPAIPVVLPYAIELHDLWDRWWNEKIQKEMELKDEKGRKNHLKASPPIMDLRRPTSETRKFLADLVAKTNNSFHGFLRSISVKCLINGTDLITKTTDIIPQQVHDVQTCRGYWNLPIRQSRFFSNRRMADVNGNEESHLFSEFVFGRVIDKPFIVSEWGHPWPNKFRAELPLWMAAMACFQEWNGCILSGYRTGHEEDVDWITAPFDSFNDPCVIGLMPSAALLFHRNDVDVANRGLQLTLNQEYVYEDDALTAFQARSTRLVPFRKVEIALHSAPSSLPLSATQPEDLYEKRFQMDKNSHLRSDYERGLVFIDSPKSQAVIGRLKLAEDHDLSNLKVFTSEEFGVVSLNSMNDETISRSGDLFVTLVSQAQNSGFSAHEQDGVYVVDHAGHAPVLLKDTPVRVYIRTNREAKWTIQAIHPDGTPGETISYQIANQFLSFRAGTHGTLYYRLKAEKSGY